MATKKNKKKKSGTAALLDFTMSETLRGVWGVLLVAIALFLALAGFGLGGAAGNLVYSLLADLLGVGYALLPLSVLAAAFVLFRSLDEEVNVLQMIGVAVFLIAGLGLISIVSPARGGIVGGAIAAPLIAAFDSIAASIFLVAFIIAALLIIFDVHPVALWRTLREHMRLPEKDEEDYAAEDDDAYVSESMDVSEEDYEEDDGEYDEADAESETPEEQEQPQRTSFWGSKKEEPDEIPIIHAAGGVYMPPPLSLLSKNKGKPGVGDVKANANIIKRTLNNFGIQVEMDEVSIGPTVTRYAMKPAEGVRLAKIVALQSNLELALAASPVRIEAPIPGKSLVGIEVPNTSRTTLGLAPLLSDSSFSQSDKPLLVSLGRSITGIPHFTDLSRAPHMLIAGATGSGKSVTINTLIMSLLYRRGPQQLRFVMVDPKRVELTLYNSIPHLLTPVITDPKKAILALKWLAKEMDRRYDVLEAEQVRDISSYHSNVLAPSLESADGNEEELPEQMPYIVVIIDELADIMQAYPRELEAGIVRLAQMSRAVGIHLVLSTQRPSVKVITGLIKANIPSRIALQVASQIDSRTILDTGGAEKLLGAGDMLFLSGEMAKPIRIQAPYISESEVKKVVKHVAKNYEDTLPDEIDFSEGKQSDAIFSASLEDDEDDDPLYADAYNAVMSAGKASTSYLQRKLRVGYARAARLMDLLEERGVIGPADGSKAREVIGGGEQDSADTEDAEYDDEEEDGHSK